MHAAVSFPAFFLALLLAQMQPGQTGRIRVEIPPPFEGKLGHVQVLLRNTNGWMAVPHEHEGTFETVEFDKLAVGSYEVLVTADGYESVRTPVALGDQTRPVVVSITLKAARSGSGVGKPSPVDTQELSRNYPKKAVQDYEKAVEELRKNNTEKALQLLKSVTTLAPDYYVAQNTLGTVHQRMNRYRDAEDAYRRALALRPKSDEPLVNLGALYIQEAAQAPEGPAASGKILGEARIVLQEALKLNRSAIAHYLLGTVYVRSSVYGEAEDNLRRALAIEPRMPTARLMLANLYIRMQNWADALLNLDQYLSENPKASDRLQVEETRAKVAQRIQQE